MIMLATVRCSAYAARRAASRLTVVGKSAAGRPVSTRTKTDGSIPQAGRIFRGAAPRGQIKRRKLRGNLGLEGPELAEIDPHRREPPIALILNQVQVIAGLHAQSFERRRRKRDLALGRDFEAERRGQGRGKASALPERQMSKARTSARSQTQGSAHPARSLFRRRAIRHPPPAFRSFRPQTPKPDPASPAC